MTENDIAREATDQAIACLNYGREKIEHCLGQLDNGQVWWRPTDEMNSIGNLLLHLAGNLQQWIVAGVGGAEDTRKRQREFDERRAISKEELWHNLCNMLDESVNALSTATAEDLLSTQRIQGNDITKMGAMLHSVTHFQGHVQEIISFTRQQLGAAYRMHWQPQTGEEGA